MYKTNLLSTAIVVGLKIIKKKGERKNAGILILEKRTEDIPQESGSTDQIQVQEERDTLDNDIDGEVKEETMRLFKNTFKDEVYENFIKKNKERMRKNDIECLVTFRQMQQYLMEKEDFGLLFNYFFKVFDVMTDESNFNDNIIEFVNSRFGQAYDSFTEKYPEVEIDCPDVDWIMNNLDGFEFANEPK